MQRLNTPKLPNNMNTVKSLSHLLSRLPALILLNLLLIGITFGQYYMIDIKRDSARSDIRTNGVIEKAKFIAGDADIQLTVNVPAFQMTLWQNGKEVKNYPIGVGKKDYPIFIGLPKARSIIWNPDWIPPDSEWVKPALRGVIIKPTDPRNPLGKLKIPLGYGYLIHQAKGTQDLGNLVSHGCVRVMKNDLYDLSEKLISARSLDFSAENISKAKKTKETFIVEFNKPLQLEITYDTIVIKAGKLHIYPDVYSFNKNTIANLRKELEKNKIDHSNISDTVLKRMLTQAKAKRQYVISIENIRTGQYIKGKAVPVLVQKKKRKRKTKRRRRRRK